MKRTSFFLITAILLAAVAAAPAMESNRPVTLTCWGWLYAVECLQENIEAFNQAYPDIHVVFQTMAADEIYRRLPGGLTTGIDIPDVVVLEDSHVPEMSATGGLLDLTARIAQARPLFNKFKWGNYLYKGRIQAIPWESGPVALYYRRDIMSAAGLPPEPAALAAQLSTWDAYYSAAKKIKAATGAYMLPVAGNGNNGRLFEILLQQQGLEYFDAEGAPALDKVQYIETLQMLGRLYKEGLTLDCPSWSEAWQAGIRDGRTATLVGAAWLGGYIENFLAPDTKGLWGVTPLPAWTAGGCRTSNNGGTALAIPKKTRRTRAAWTFVQFMLARSESHIKMMRQRDCFPAFEPAYADPYFDEPVLFFSGQPVRRLFADLSKDIPVWRYSPYYGLASNLCSAEIQSYLRGVKDARTALADAVAAIKKKIK